MGPEYSGGAPKPHPTPKPAATFRATATPRPPPSRPATNDKARAEENERRLEQIRAEALAIAKRDGDETATVVAKFAGCSIVPRCIRAAKQLDNRVARHALLAILTAHVSRPKHGEAATIRNLANADSKIAAAQEQLDRAREAAKERVEKTLSLHDTLRREQAGQAAADQTCKASLALCRKRCDEGTAAFCTALGLRLADADPPDFDAALVALNQACDSGWQTGCMYRDGVETDRDRRATKTASLWADVETAADDIAKKKHVAKFARQNLRGRRNARATKRVEAHIKALVKESYCPAFHAFMAERTRTEFTKLAKDHCDSRPPTGTGLGGTDVTLTAECRATYLTTCPAPPPKPKGKSTPTAAKDFVPECAAGRPWLFSPARWQCQCGVDIGDPCKSRGCEIRPSKNDICGCDCDGDKKVTP